MSINTLLLSDVIIKERSIVHGNVDPKLIYNDIKIAQDFYIKPILGSALFEKIQDAVTANDWTGLSDYKALLDNYIIDALVQFTLAELPGNSYQFTNKGVVRKQGENTDLPSMSDLVSISNRYRERGEGYAKKLKLYLQASVATNKFPEYTAPGNTVDTIFPDQTSFTMPVYLGDDDNCNRPGIFPNKPYSG